MPNDVVIVPCHERPEYTRLCLEYLAGAQGVHAKNVWLCQDNHGILETGMCAVADFGRKVFQNFVYIAVGPHDTYGNSLNITESLRLAYMSGAERIFLVEDDIMVAPDFLKWQERMLNEEHPFAACASALNKSAHFQINGPDRMDEGITDRNAFKKVIGPYSSHAVAFHRVALGDLIKYFDQKKFVWASGLEQDLCTQQFLKARGHVTVWPYVPRAFNIGMRSYHINTAMPLYGTLDEKVAALRRIIKDPAKLRDMSCNNQAITAVPEFPNDSIFE